MKAGWKTVKLREIGEHVKGSCMPDKGTRFESWSVPAFETGQPEVVEGRSILAAKTPVKIGDVLICKINPRINRVWRVSETGNKLPRICSTEWVVFRLKNPAQVLPEWVQIYCSSPTFREWITGQITGTTGSHARAKPANIFDQEIPLPPLAEQKRIVALLDEAFAGIDEAKAKAEACLSDAEESFNSLIDAKISFASQAAPSAPLEELCDKNRVITYGVIKLGDPTSDGVYCLRCGNLKRLRIELDGIRKIPHSLSKEYSRTVLKGGELLVNVRGTLGGVCVAPNTMSGWNVAREIAVIPLSSDAASVEYLSYHVATTASQSWLMGKRKGAAYVGINIEDIRRLPIYLPPRKEQERVAAVLSEAHEHTLDLQNIYEKKAKKLLELKSSLLAQAFAGELTA